MAPSGMVSFSTLARLLLRPHTMLRRIPLCLLFATLGGCHSAPCGHNDTVCIGNSASYCRYDGDITNDTHVESQQDCGQQVCVEVSVEGGKDAACVSSKTKDPRCQGIDGELCADALTRLVCFHGYLEREETCDIACVETATNPSHPFRSFCAASATPTPECKAAPDDAPPVECDYDATSCRLTCAGKDRLVCRNGYPTHALECPSEFPCAELGNRILCAAPATTPECATGDRQFCRDNDAMACIDGYLTFMSACGTDAVCQEETFATGYHQAYCR
jgi:hypothetical protein